MYLEKVKTPILHRESSINPIMWNPLQTEIEVTHTGEASHIGPLTYGASLICRIMRVEIVKT
jgi:hypothetical protein